MTKAEYLKAYRDAKRQLPIIEREIQKQLLNAYIDAGQKISLKIAEATVKDLSEITIGGAKSVLNQIVRSANEISAAVEDALPIAITESYKNYTDIETAFIFSIAQKFPDFKVTELGLQNLAVRINEQLVRDVFNIQFQDGLRYSDRIWREFKPNGLPGGVNGDFQYRIKNLITSGTIQGRDPIKIAEDLNVYIKDGKVALVKRYGQLQRGTAEFAKRISDRVDWRAVRLVRSVQNSAMQIGSVSSAQINPGHSGEYNWHKTRGNPIDPDGSRNASGLRCIDLEEFNPYTAETVPEYQHSNCGCWIEPILRARREFENDIQDYLNGNNNYIGDWYQEYVRSI
jgi:hypothetical protein